MGDLLFGEKASRHKDFVPISPALLCYVVKDGLVAQTHFKFNNDLANFIMHIIEKVCASFFDVQIFFLIHAPRLLYA